jgi:hypothetical protein
MEPKGSAWIARIPQSGNDPSKTKAFSGTGVAPE